VLSWTVNSGDLWIAVPMLTLWRWLERNLGIDRRHVKVDWRMNCVHEYWWCPGRTWEAAHWSEWLEADN
jgi:hypothetical protein